MYDKAAHAFLSTLKFVFDWFVTNKMLEELNDVVFSNDDMVFFNADSDSVTFFSFYIYIFIFYTVFSDDMVLVIVDRNNVSLDNANFDDDDDPETIIHV